MRRLERIGLLLVSSEVTAVALLRADERPPRPETGVPLGLEREGTDWPLLLELEGRLRLDLRRSSLRSCTG